MEMLQGVWKQHLRPRAVVGYGVKIFLLSPPNYVTRSPGIDNTCNRRFKLLHEIHVFDSVSGLNNFLEFSQHPSCLDETM